MEPPNQSFHLLELLYGEGAARARKSASSRLLAWCRAFEEWLAERERSYKPGTKQHDLAAWRRLLQPGGELRRRPKKPWELRPADIAERVAWLEAQGYTPITIHLSVGVIANFYRWCGERGVDPACGPAFNPAACVPRPVLKRYDGAKLLSRAEVRALLGILARDRSPIGMRDYAFFLARLRTGVPLAALRGLRWGQIEAGGEGARLRWRPEGAPFPLPPEVWEAITSYLAASGRLAGMQAESCIFAPLVNSITPQAGSVPGDWREGSPISRTPLANSLKLYGRAVGIPEEKLNLKALRRTAIRLRLDAGEGLEGMHAFLDSQDEPGATRYELSFLPHLPDDEGESGGRTPFAQPGSGADGEEPPVPSRRAGALDPRDRWHIRHGFYAQSLPSEEVLAVLAEDIRGLDEQIGGLRRLMCGVFARHTGGDLSFAMRMLDILSLSAVRLARLLKAQKELDKSARPGEWAERVQAMLDEFQVEDGQPPVSQDVPEQALEVEPELPDDARLTAVNAAALRYVLRRVFRRAMEAEDLEDLMHLLEIYGRGSARLARLLVAGGSTQTQPDDDLRKEIDQALREVTEEWGLT